MTNTAQRRIGARLRAARGTRTKADLAAALGVDPTTVLRWERGESVPQTDRQREIARVYGRPWAELFDPAGDDDVDAALDRDLSDSVA